MAIPNKFAGYERAGDEARTRDVHLGKKAVSRWKRNAVPVTFLAFYFLYFLTFAITASGVKPKRPPNTYSQTVNLTLDYVMWCHEQHHGKLTWQELNAEVCQHMKVRRTSPWDKTR